MFKALENVSIVIGLGDTSPDEIELQSMECNIERDSANNQLVWHVANLHQSESAVLTFASKGLSYDDMFPLDVSFNEQYSLIDMQISVDAPKPIDALTGEEMSLKLSSQVVSDGYKINAD